MPAQLTDTITLHGHTFRIHRIRGFAAFEAKAAWAGIVGEKGAMILACSAAQIVEMARKIVTPAQWEEFDEFAREEQHRALALLAIVQCMQRDRMTPHDMGQLVHWFVLGHVEVQRANGEWTLIKQTDDLDAMLDGSNDGDVWNSLVWRQVPHCLGPTIAIADT